MHVWLVWTGNPTTIRSLIYVCLLYNMSTMLMQQGSSSCCLHLDDSMEYFQASAESLTTLPLLDEPLASGLHELSKQLESTPVIRKFSQDQVL